MSGRSSFQKDISGLLRTEHLLLQEVQGGRVGRDVVMHVLVAWDVLQEIHSCERNVQDEKITGSKSLTEADKRRM
jgi:hypothetical protein